MGIQVKMLENHTDIPTEFVYVRLFIRYIQTIYCKGSFEMVSRRLMHRSSVLFPDPEGPMTTTTSPFLIVRLISFNTWKSP